MKKNLLYLFFFLSACAPCPCEKEKEKKGSDAELKSLATTFREIPHHLLDEHIDKQVYKNEYIFKGRYFSHYPDSISYASVAARGWNFDFTVLLRFRGDKLQFAKTFNASEVVGLQTVYCIPRVKSVDSLEVIYTTQDTKGDIAISLDPRKGCQRVERWSMNEKGIKLIETVRCSK